MSNTLRLQKSLNNLDTLKVDRPNTYPGILGCTTNGGNQVDVANRPGYVWVRLRSNLSEVIQAFNPSVSPVFDLPVIVSRDTNDPTRYVIVGRDSTGYLNWGVSAYLPRHSNAHEFPVDSDAGNDIVWVRGNQFTPLLVTPSGSSGAMAVVIQPGTYYMNGWHYVPQSGVSLSGYKPTGTSARMVMVYADGGGNIAVAGGNYFTATITGTSAILPYLPSVTGTMLPLAGVRLLSGTSTIQWANIYDLREHVATPWNAFGATGTAAMGAGTLLPSSTNNVALSSHTHQMIGFIAGSGTANNIPKFVSATAIGDSGVVFGSVTGTLAFGAGTSGLSTTNNVSISNHTHFITGSSNPGAAASLLSTDSSGYTQVTRLRVAVGGSAVEYLSVEDTSATLAKINKVSDSGIAQLDINPSPSDGVSDALFRFFRSTNTSGVCHFDVYKGDNTTSLNHYIAGNTHTYLGLLSGNYTAIGPGHSSVPETTVHIRQDTATTNAVLEVLRLESWVESTGVGAAGFGVGLGLYAESASNAQYRQQGAIETVWTVATDASRNARLDLYTFPKGASAIGKSGFWSSSAISTAETIIANGTGDVTEAITILYSCAEITGTDTGGGICTLEPGDSYNLVSDGTNTLTVTCAADGSVTIARSAGTDTYKVSLWMVWL